MCCPTSNARRTTSVVTYGAIRAGESELRSRGGEGGSPMGPVSGLAPPTTAE
jgi:hypothetical protein